MSAGHATARAAGNDDPDNAQCIHLGLVAAARLNPLMPEQLTEQEASRLIRLAMFDLGPRPGQFDQNTRHLVEDRLLAAIDQHLLDTTEKFSAWFHDISGLAHQVSKQRKHGGPIEREVVRQILLEIIFGSATYVGDTVMYSMQAFRLALPAELNDREHRIFNLMYGKVPWLGGSPLLLLIDRFDFLKEALFSLWWAPDDPE